jgi:prepilin-type N-terminal cleavage/methylation domain-containing protein
MKRYSDTRHQRGFTLVEIAIVLMIIGLLIGGILRGQELIQSARVRNIIDQKSAIQTAYIGFLDRYRMLPGDLTLAQAKIVGNGAVQSTAIGNSGPGDGTLNPGTESVVFFQNLTAAGFLSCGACMKVTAAATEAPSVLNSPNNVYGNFVWIGNFGSNNNGSGWFDPILGIDNIELSTGGSIPSQVLAEVERKADDGWPGTGQLRFDAGYPGTNPGNIKICAPGLSGATALTAATFPWANPSEANCQAAWLL